MALTSETKLHGRRDRPSEEAVLAAWDRLSHRIQAVECALPHQMSAAINALTTARRHFQDVLEGRPRHRSGREDVVSEPHIFLDCDGVLADFDAAGRILWGEEPRQYEARVGSNRFWQELEDRGDFYRTLPLMPDAMRLYEGVRHLNPTILTGCPRGNWAEAQKVDWAERHFPGVPIITCRSSHKRDHAKPGDVLIDDWPQHRHRWIEMGGVFISHFDAASSLAALWAHYPHLLRATS